MAVLQSLTLVLVRWFGRPTLSTAIEGAIFEQAR